MPIPHPKPDLSQTHNLLRVLSMDTWWNFGHELKKRQDAWGIQLGTLASAPVHVLYVAKFQTVLGNLVQGHQEPETHAGVRPFRLLQRNPSSGWVFFHKAKKWAKSCSLNWSQDQKTPGHPSYNTAWPTRQTMAPPLKLQS